jgi:hypothetical protein
MNVNSKLKTASLVLLASLGLSSTVKAQNIPNCPQGHCSGVSDKINKYCINQGLAGKPFLVIGPNGEECFCPCSCVTGDTEISMSNSSNQTQVITQLTVGSLVASYGEGSLNKVQVDNLLGDKNPTQHKVVKVTFSDGGSISVSSNHTFIDPSQKVVQASSLKAGDAILNLQKNPVYVLTVQTENQQNRMFNLIINSGSQNARDHIIGTNGYLSGDWLLQSNQDAVQTAIDARLGKISTYSQTN